MVDYDTAFENHNCKICGRLCKNRRSIGNHLARSHNGYDLRKYVLEFFLDCKIPLCSCGCEKEVKWHKTLYRFNDYISGHNNMWSKNNQPDISEDQIEKRNESIRKTYRENYDELSKKISSSVKEALDNPTFRKEQSKRTTSLWENEEFRERVSKAQKKSWKENYEERYNKVFTSEFGKKISKSNRERNIKKKSELEKQVIEIITQRLNHNIDQDYWVNHKLGTKCFDAFIPVKGMLIELDGEYWHGLDRDENFTLAQINNMANDFLKNKIAIDKKLSLLRIKINDQTPESISEIESIDDLMRMSHYIQIDGETLVDRMFRFRKDDQNILSREFLLKAGNHSFGGSKQYVEKNVLPKLVDFFYEYFNDSSRGWVMPTCNDSIDDALKSVKSSKPVIASGIISGSPRSGNNFLKSRMKSFWYADNGPAVSCKDKEILHKVISYRVGLNNSKLYEYELSNGESTKANETFDICPKSIRNGFVVQRRSVSWFPPVIARDIWRFILDDIEDPMVWDPSAGFGARMLGFISSYAGGTYVATDPANMTFDDLDNLKNEIMGSHSFSGSIFLQNEGSEKIELPENFLDGVFTSPPYFDLEKYFDEPGQCWKDYPSIDLWKEHYLLPTIKTAFSALKKDRMIALNVSVELEEIVSACLIECGFLKVTTLRFDRKRDHFSRKSGITIALGEPVLVYKKP